MELKRTTACPYCGVLVTQVETMKMGGESWWFTPTHRASCGKICRGGAIPRDTVNLEENVHGYYVTGGRHACSVCGPVETAPEPPRVVKSIRTVTPPPIVKKSEPSPKVESGCQPPADFLPKHKEEERLHIWASVNQR